MYQLGPLVKACLSQLDADADAAAAGTAHDDPTTPCVPPPVLFFSHVVPENVIEQLGSAYRRACARHGSATVIDRALQRGMMAASASSSIDDDGADALVVVWTSVLYLYTR